MSPLFSAFSIGSWSSNRHAHDLKGLGVPAIGASLGGRWAGLGSTWSSRCFSPYFTVRFGCWTGGTDSNTVKYDTNKCIYRNASYHIIPYHFISDHIMCSHTIHTHIHSYSYVYIYMYLYIIPIHIFHSYIDIVACSGIPQGSLCQAPCLILVAPPAPAQLGISGLHWQSTPRISTVHRFYLLRIYISFICILMHSYELLLIISCYFLLLFLLIVSLLPLRRALSDAKLLMPKLQGLCRIHDRPSTMAISTGCETRLVSLGLSSNERKNLKDQIYGVPLTPPFWFHCSQVSLRISMVTKLLVNLLTRNSPGTPAFCHGAVLQQIFGAWESFDAWSKWW